MTCARVLYLVGAVAVGAGRTGPVCDREVTWRRVVGVFIVVVVVVVCPGAPELPLANPRPLPVLPPPFTLRPEAFCLRWEC